MPDAAQINRSINSIRTELEFLRDSGVINQPQFQSISAQLPQPGGAPSPYVDPYYSNNGKMNPQMQQFPSQIAQQAQDPTNPAHPQHPKHHEWAKNLVSKFGQAAVFGAGATAGSDLVNAIF